MSMMRKSSMLSFQKDLQSETLLLQCPCVKKGMSVTTNWKDRYLKLYESKDGDITLVYYKNKDADRPNGKLLIRPNSKVRELKHCGKTHKRENVIEIQSGGKTFTCAMPNEDERKKWVNLLREHSDNSDAPSRKTLHGRRKSQMTINVKDTRVEDLEIKVVSHHRVYKSSVKGGSSSKGISSQKSLTRKFSTSHLNRVTYGFDFGVKDFRSGKFKKIMTKKMTDKEWKQVHKTISKAGLLRLFGSSKGHTLKWPDSHISEESDEQKIQTRAHTIELYLHSLLNMPDISDIQANAAPWVCVVSFPQLHHALKLEPSIQDIFCRIGYQRKVVAFGEDPEPELSVDFDLDKEVTKFQVSRSLVTPPVPTRIEASASNSNIKQPRTSKTTLERIDTKLNIKAVIVYSGMLYKKPTSGGFGKGKLRWFSLSRDENDLNQATLYYYKISKKKGEKGERKEKGHVVIDGTCSVELGTNYCLASRWRFCIRKNKTGNIMLEAEAGSEKEFGCWVMHFLRYTTKRNELTAVSPKASFLMRRASRRLIASQSRMDISVAQNDSVPESEEKSEIRPADIPLGAPPTVDLQIEDVDENAT